MLGTVCSCGKQMFDTRGLCLTCLDHHHQERQSRPARRFMLPDGAAPKSASPSTPLSSPRQSSDLPYRSRSSYRLQPSASQAMDNAFATQADGTSIFPASLYRSQRTASPRASPPGTPNASSRATSIPPDHISLSGRNVQPSTPDLTVTTRGDPVGARSYSPMAAGFARLNRPHPASQQRGVVSERRNLDLEARMFDGPA